LLLKCVVIRLSESENTEGGISCCRMGATKRPVAGRCCVVSWLFVQERQQKRQEVVSYELSPFCGGVNAVVLNGIGDGVDMGVKLRQERKMELVRGEMESLVELLDVVGTVVGREGDAGENDFAAGLKKSRDVMGRPRRPSLPPNSTMTTAGCRRRTSGRRSTPSLVVLPLIPKFTTL
jgi:hypothetical protein